MNTEHNEDAFCMAEQMINTGSLSDLSPVEQHELNEQMIRELTISTNSDGTVLGGILVNCKSHNFMENYFCLIYSLETWNALLLLFSASLGILICSSSAFQGLVHC